MEELLKTLSAYGPVGVIAAILFWQNIRITNRLMDLIEKNTKAFDELKAIIDKCQVIHRD